MPDRYLVTGGCGFIGSHLADALIQSGNEVVVLDDLSTGQRDNLDPAAELIVGDIRDRDLLKRATEGCNGIFHLAAIASVPKCTHQWQESHTVNLSASIGIFEQAAEAGIPVVYASSSAVYGDVAQSPIREDAPKEPISAYGADKYAMELHARAGANARGLRSFGLRFFNVYGPRQDPSSPYSGVIAIFVKNAREGKPITVYGDGSQVRDFVYVADVVDACRGAMRALGRQDKASAQVSNVCTGRGTTIRHLGEMIVELASSKSSLAYSEPRVGDIKTSVGDPSNLVSLLGITADMSLKDGLALLMKD
ncbi:NAD-dependent epimerase/dehydratase family protein [Microvirga pudoricolor]|uniref:NAD-dependent epimerase/dehydratase family protein n=1 Tax=Microvirga pudoricolor TaxID=2778729 RepID=UPI0019512B35|nr:NAD-dependent epimerase/dehydratase family protein [Microvirga pudoricolor]MBM6596237.1 NAD-dependent epimerase/dehydratase family protein [Microvirga pudoricolor]